LSRRSRPAIARVAIETLESRRLLSAITWTGDGNGSSWSDPDNWSPESVPGASDDATIPSGSDVQLGTGTFVVQDLTLQGTASLDLQEATLFVDYGSGTDPIGTIVSYLTSGYTGGGGNWSPSNPGIDDSTVFNLNNSQSKLVYSVGYVDGADGITFLSSGDIEISPTLAGDSKLQGNVVYGDFQLLSQYFGESTSWDEGDFTYNGTTNLGDYDLLQQNGLGATSAPLPAPPGVLPVSVPEPTVTGILLVAGAGFLIRRRKDSRKRSLSERKTPLSE
jgi:hypothetical protein